ncbi:group 1 glycosyl transferase [Caballeronia arvi]|uniref:Group 1 glycosyl transferase n=1 Tax=Caballeronia arvi TaxID=1777135 RepID=A0A158EPC3_9BURK|nr:glycosyltransferase family 4 protein [Caballeronia arvi]SAL09432.1 group 1 glycosyl transferase [Caballeronia arvi]
MKIAFVSGLYPPAIMGGAEIVLQTIVEGVREEGHEVVVLTTKEGGDHVREVVNGVRVIRVPIQNIYWHGLRDRPGPLKRAVWHSVDSLNVRMVSIAKDILMQERPDTINVHKIDGWSAGILGVGQSLGIPTVQVLHSWDFMCPNANMFRKGRMCASRCLSCRILRIPHRSISNNADAVVGISQFMLDQHVSEGYFERTKHRVVIHNARDLPSAKNVPPRSPTRGLPKKTILAFVGTINQGKGIELLMNEFLSIGNPDAELWIAGKGQSQYEATLKSRYASPQIKFLGYVEQAELFPHIDVLIVPTLFHENFATVVLEAFAFGVPVVGSRRGGTPEMIRDGVNGKLFEPNNEGELATILSDLLQNRDELESLGREAKASADEYSDVRRWVNEYIRLNQDLAAIHES